jgi:hypothetical protein
MSPTRKFLGIAAFFSMQRYQKRMLLVALHATAEWFGSAKPFWFYYDVNRG